MKQEQDNFHETFIERAVLGSLLLLDAPLPPVAVALEPEYFTDMRNANVWMAIKDLSDAGQPFDEVSVHRKLRDWGEKGLAGHITTLTESVPGAMNIWHYANVLTEDGRKRMLQRRLSEATERAGADASFAEIAAGVQDAIAAAGKEASVGGLEHIGKPLMRTLDEIFKRKADPDHGRIAKTGLAELDKAVELRAGQLTIIAGRPAMGKSALAGNIAAHCARDKARGCVALFSLEMSAGDVIMRLMLGESRLPEQSVVDMITNGSKGGAALPAAIHGLNLYLDDRSSIGTGDIRRALLPLPKVRLVVVDYLQLARQESQLERHDLRVGAITKGLKAIAKEFSCHVIALAQLNRNVETRKPPRPVMSDLRDSGNIEEDADNVWLLYRAEYYDAKDAQRGVGEIIVGKQRHGATGTIPVAWAPRYQCFQDLSKEQLDEWESRSAA